jgi:hypothetical protein
LRQLIDAARNPRGMRSGTVNPGGLQIVKDPSFILAWSCEIQFRPVCGDGASYGWIGVWEIDLAIPDLQFQFLNFLNWDISTPVSAVLYLLLTGLVCAICLVGAKEKTDLLRWKSDPSS